MSEILVKTEVRELTKTVRPHVEVGKFLSALLPGGKSVNDDALTLSLPSYKSRTVESTWKGMLSDPKEKFKRSCLLSQLKALVELNQYAKENQVSLKAAAAQIAERNARLLENAWVQILERNRDKEKAVRECALFFTNLKESKPNFKGKVFVIDASPEEISSEAGCEYLAKLLADYYKRPDPRLSRGYLVVPGWVGSKSNHERLATLASHYRAMLFTDAPDYDDEETLRTAASEGELLETLPGESVADRYTVMFGNLGRARTRFKGRFAEEKGDVYVNLSAPYSGMHLHNIAIGQPWKPAVGYQNPITGIDGVKLDLLLDKKSGYFHYSRHRINPAIVLCKGSKQVVLWGLDTLNKADSGIQIGMADTEMRVIRYAEWIVNKYGILDNLDDAERIVKSKLSRFITRNSGAKHMFKAGSRISVSVNRQERALIIDFHLFYHVAVEQGILRLSKPVRTDENGEIKVQE